jgi:hypothetical protein
MKIAVLLCGNIRTWEKTKDSFDAFFKNIEYDLFISTYNQKYNYSPYWLNLYPNFKNNDIILSDEQIINMFYNKTQNIIITSYNENKLFLNNEIKKMHPKMIEITNFETFFSQYNNIRKGIQLIDEYERKNGFKYDIIIKTRFDLLYNGTLNQVNINYNDILINTNNIYPNDWFFIVKRNMIDDFINFIICEYYFLIHDTSKDNIPHGLFENSCKYNNLIIKQYLFILQVIRDF